MQKTAKVLGISESFAKNFNSLTTAQFCPKSNGNSLQKRSATPRMQVM